MMRASILVALAGLALCGNASQQIGSYQMSYPFPSPDGKQLVFQANLDGRWQLYTMTINDGAIKRLHVSVRDDTHPAWSPDGKSLAFISNRDGNDEVYLLTIATGSVRSVAPHPGKDGHPKWSADGAWLVFNRTFDPADKGGDAGSAIVRVRSDGSALEILSDTENVETFPSFSPDGRSVAFVEWFANKAGERNRNGEIIVMDIATRERRNITQSETFDAHPYWGPSGRWIYYSTPTEAAPREPVVHRIRPDGTGKEALTEVDGAPEGRPIPSLDEQTLYFNRVEGGRALLFRKTLPKDSPR